MRTSRCGRCAFSPGHLICCYQPCQSSSCLALTFERILIGQFQLVDIGLDSTSGII